MKAVILAAGRGSRMKTLTASHPKCLVELASQPLIHWQIKSLRAAGVSEIGIVTGYRGDSLRQYGDRHFVNPRWESTNMVASLRCAEEWLSTEPCIVSYSDIFYAASTVVALMQNPAPLAVAYDPRWLALWQARFADPLSDAETFRINDASEITEIGAKATTIDQIHGQYMGLLRFSPPAWTAAVDLIDALPTDRRDKLDMTGLLSRLIASGFKIRGCANQGPWGEVDSGDDRAFYGCEIDAGRIDMDALSAL